MLRLRTAPLYMLIRVLLWKNKFPRNWLNASVPGYYFTKVNIRHRQKVYYDYALAESVCLLCQENVW